MRGRSFRALAGLTGLLVVLGAVGLVVGSGPKYRSTTSIGSAGSELYFTTYSPETVRKVTYKVTKGHLAFTGRILIARLTGADGAVFSPGGSLLVGGGNGSVYSVNLATGRVSGVNANAPAFMLSPGPDGHHLYTAGLPGPLAVLDTDPLTAGRPIALSGDDSEVTGLAFAPGGTAIYTSSNPSGIGDIGTIDLATGQTHRLFQNVPGAHGALYDPYTSDFITMGGSTILQLSASDPSQVVSETTLPIGRIDQGAIDGHGRIFAASNGGDLVLIDYSTTHRVGSLADQVSSSFLASNLDDVAPLIGAGAAPTPTLARWWTDGGTTALVLAGLMVLGAAFSFLIRRQRARLPRWDRRRAGAPGAVGR
jgi:WD40 repeat protein